MKKAFMFSVFLLITFLGCNNDNGQLVIGDLNVIVVINGYGIVEDAEVYTNPKSIQGTTDEFGTVLLKGLPIGSFEVFATLADVGSGKSVANIKENELTEVLVNIVPGVYVGLAPTIDVILPGQPAEFSEGEVIAFSADIEDENTASQDIIVKWESDLDGVLNTNPPDANGNAAFTTSTLTRGVHEITLTAENKDGYSSTATMQVSTMSPAPINLEVPTVNQGKVSLNWSDYTGNSFSKYEVFRTDGNCSEQNKELLTTITDIGNTSYVDEIPPMEYKVCYFVRVTNSDNYTRTSNHETVDLPSGHIFNFEPYDMLKHPTQNFVYLLDRGGERLIKFDYINMEVVGETGLQGTIGYCDIGDNGYGVEVYTPSSDGWIYVYSADDLSQTTSINTGLATSSVVVNGLGHVIAAVDPSPWWEQPVRTYMRSTGINIDGNGDFERDRLRMIPGKNEAISISTTVSPIDMEYFKFSSEGYFEIHQDDQYHGDYPLNPKIFRISDDGTYSITSRDGAVYLANSSMEYKGQLQHGVLEFSDFAFSEDGSIIYAATSNRKSIQIGHYPSLIRDDEILTRGFPIFIIRDDDKIISLSKTSESSINTGIEIIEL